MATQVEVKGLSEALKNFQKLNDAVKTDISRFALREASWVLARAGRAATYSTFRRITGAIRAGLGVAVQQEARDEEIKAYVVEYPRGGSPFGALSASKQQRQRAKGGVAYWWRFLEKGTGPRRNTKTPKFLRTGRVARSGRVAIRQASAVNVWAKSANRGAITARPWLRPSFERTVASGIETFREEALDKIEQEVTAMPK
jgi:HK97 gp10 family phage protein